MNFTQLTNEVLATIKRPDKIAIVQREINAALTFFSGNQQFSRDSYAQLVNISPTEFVQVVPFTLLTRYRRIKYIKRGGTKQYLHKLQASQLGTACDMKDKYYIAGSGIAISMVALAPTLDIAFYQYPPYLTNSAPDYWMLDQGWPMVFNRVTAKLFTDIGDDSSARLHEGYAVKDYQAFCDDAEKDLGYE